MSKRTQIMFAGELTENTKTNSFNGTLHGRKFDIAITLASIEARSKNSPTFEVMAQNAAGRMIRIGSAWDQLSEKTQNRYISMSVDVGHGPFRVNAVQNEEQRGSGAFDIIPFVGNATVQSGSISGELTSMDADNAFAGYVANMMFDLNFSLVENEYKTEDNHPDYRIMTSSPRNVQIRVGAAWMAKSESTGNEYISLLINTPDGDLRVNAVQNEEQRGGDTFSIIPFVEAGDGSAQTGAPLALVG